jgi:membrane protein
MSWLADNGSHDKGSSGSGRAVDLSSGAALVLIGLRQRSLAGAIVSALGGHLAYQAFRGRAGSRLSAGPISPGRTRGAAVLYGDEQLKYEKPRCSTLTSSTAAEDSTNIASGTDRYEGHDQAEQSRIPATGMCWKQLLLDRKMVWALVRETISNWSADRVPSLGAALAYYTVFSIAPLLVIAIAVVGLVFGTQAAQSSILKEIGGLVGQKGSEAIQAMLQSAHKPALGTLAGIFGVILLLLGASGVFGELQEALNTIWQVPRRSGGLWQNLKSRFISYGIVLAVGFLLLVSLLLSAAVAAAGKFFGGFLPVSEVILHVLNFGVSFAVVTALFAMIFKVLPEAPIAWKDVWAGAGFTALLFELGKQAIGLYLGKSGIASAYGAASSLVVMLAWVYYSAQILYFGAEFTRAYAAKRGYRPER